MRTLLAADLFCGALRQPKICGLADAAVDQFVMRRAEHPEHVPFIPAHRSMGSVASELWAMGSLQDASLVASARFAEPRQVRISLVETNHQRVSAPGSVVLGLLGRLPIAESRGRSPHRAPRALRRAMLAVVSHFRSHLERLQAAATDTRAVQPMLWAESSSLVLRFSPALVAAILLRRLKGSKRSAAVAAMSFDRKNRRAIGRTFEVESRLIFSHGVSLSSRRAVWLEPSRCYQHRAARSILVHRGAA